MRKLQILWQLVLADFRERTRRYSYLITLMVALFIGYLVLSGKYAFQFGKFTPIYNSHWIGTIMALAGAAMFTLIGFYIVRSAISHDRKTRVGEILATTQLSNITYLFAKFISNLLVLWSMVSALVLIAFIGMVSNMPFDKVSITAFIIPFILFPYTLTIVVASLAVLFDTARWLRGTIGNIIYFFMAEFMIVSGLFHFKYFDGAGMGIFEISVRDTINAVYPGEKVPMQIGFIRIFDDVSAVVTGKLVVWNGIDWTTPLVLSRLIWPAIALGLFLIAILLFDRFEHSKKITKKKKVKKNIIENIEIINSQNALEQSLSYKSIPVVKYTSSIVSLIVAELKLNFKQLKPIWYFIGLALVTSQFFVPFEISRKYIIPASMIWPLILWSSVGTREEQFNMRSLMFCSSGVHTKQFIALLFSGVIIAITLCLPTLTRAIINGEHAYLLLLISSILFLPATAFAFGVVSGSKKLFEVLYLVIWYGGSIDKIKALDVLGTTDASTSITRVFVFITIAVSSTIVAYIARQKRAET